MATMSSSALAIPDRNRQVEIKQNQDQLANLALNDLDAEEVGKVVSKLQEEIKIIKLQLENLPGYEKGEVPEHLQNLKMELERTFSSLEQKNEMLINAMTKNFGKTHQDLPNFRLPAIQNTSKKQSLFALQAEPDDYGSIIGLDNALKAKGAGILRPTASNSNKNGPYKAKKSLGGVMRARQMRDVRHKKFLDEQEDLQNPPPISEEDINKGMISLLNRGIIPKDVDLTPAFEKGAPPVQFRGMKFHDKAEMHAKNEVHTEKFNRNSIRFDLQPPVRRLDETSQMALVPMSTALVLANEQSPRGIAGTLPAIEGSESKPSGVQLALPAARHQGIQEDGGGIHLAGPDEGKSKDPNAQARGYNELMDEYSLHQLMFRKGKLIDQTPEFVSFRRTYIDKWGPVSFILMNFEKLFTDHDVQLAYVDGRQLVELARENLEKPTKEELFDCINNKEAVGKLVKIPTRMFKGPEGPILAATVIQKNFRMYKAREAYKHLRFLMKKATIIQRRFRLYLFQKQTKDRVEELTNESLFVWKEMMDEFKQKWPSIKSRRRVEVHISSISIEELKRISMAKFLQRENAQLSRIFALKDPDVEVIYVTPFQMTSDVLGYYMKILEIGEVNSPQSRLHILVPDNVNRFPHHFSLAQVLIYSPKTLKKMKNLIQGKQAFIVPGTPSIDDIKLSIRLAIPILSGEPSKQHLYSTKSGAKKIFQLADVPTPICSVDIYDEQEFIHSLAQLIAKNLYVTTWIFKIDDEFNGRGHAHLNVDQIKPLQQLKKKQLDPDLDLVEQIKPILAKYLPKKAIVAMPMLFKSWAEYMTSFCRVGGIIEAAPTCMSHQMASPSIAFLIEPDGQVQVIGSMDRFTARAYVNAGCFFPQQSLPNMNMMTICKSIGDILYEKGVIGHVTVDLVSFPDPTSPSAHPLFWAVDLNCNLTDYTASCLFFDFLMEGKLDQLTGKYTINNSNKSVLGGDSTNDASSRGGMAEGEDEDNFSMSQGSQSKSQISSEKRSPYNKASRRTNNYSSAEHKRDFSEQRSFMYCKYLHHPGISKIQYKAFFHMCRLQSISFDLESRKGTAFMLQDCLQSGVLAMMTIAEERKETLAMMCEAFKFIEQQAGSSGTLTEPGNMLDESRSDEIKISDVISSIRLLNKLQLKKDEKARQMRYGGAGSTLS